MFPTSTWTVVHSVRSLGSVNWGWLRWTLGELLQAQAEGGRRPARELRQPESWVQPSLSSGLACGSTDWQPLSTEPPGKAQLL